jgi:mono/diheme cytochrome c family protein
LTGIRPFRTTACLLAALAVMGAILQSLQPPRSLPVPVAPEDDPRMRRLRWAAVKVEPRTFPPGDHGDLAERMYGWNCMPCHGAEGRGDGPQAKRLGLKPRDFTRGRFKLKSSMPDDLPFDEDLFRTISVGFPETSMPAFADFTADERWSLVDHVKSLTRLPRSDGSSVLPFEAGAARTAIGPSPAPSGDVARGERLFRVDVRCAQCHGDAGKGDGPSAAGLVDEDGGPVTLPDFARAGLLFKAGPQAEDVYRVLTTGLAGTAMPSFASLPSTDRWDLAGYVASLNRPGPAGERLFLALGCIRCHTVGKGKYVGPDLAGVGQRRPRPWLRRWLLDPPGMIAGDEEARKMAKEFPIPMPVMGLSEREVDLIADYLMSLPK